MSRLRAPVRLSDRRRLQVAVGCWLLGGALVAALPAWAQAEGDGSSFFDELRGRVIRVQGLATDPVIRRYALYAAGGIVLLWLVGRIPRLLRQRGGGGVAVPSRSANLREAQRAAQRGDHVQAGRYYEAAEDQAAAAAAYERGGALADAAAVWERLKQPSKAAPLYEQAQQWSKAAELYARIGQHAKAAALFQKGGQEVKAAEAFERAGDVEHAAALYAKNEAFDRAGELLFRLGRHGQAAEFFERALDRLRVRQGGELSPEAIQVRQALARRCGELYARAQQPAKAAVALRDHGLEVEAAEYYCQAGDWETGLELFLKHRQFDRAEAACQAHGAEGKRHIVRGERLAEEGRQRDAAREFESGQMWWRAAEMYDRAGDYAKAAEMYARHGDDERAAEMYAASGDPGRAGAALERLGKWKEAAQFYQQAGAIPQAARALQAAGDLMGAGTLLIRAQAVDEAVAVLQEIGPESEQYLGATIALGDLFLQRRLYGPAREKFEKAAAVRPIAPDFVHPTYQLAVIHEEQGDFQEALRLYEKVMAERLTYQDVQARVADLHRRQSQATQVSAADATTQVLPGGETTQVAAPPSRPRYRIVKELGRGGMGVVYRADDEVLQRTVAYKVLPGAIREDSKALTYFLREARIAASLQHPNIVTVYDAGLAGQEVYIAMEYVEGRSLQDILDAVSIPPLPRALGIFRQACLGLAHAHRQNVVHRDIKPGNMMITSAGVVKLMDFGLAAVISGVTAKVTSVRGTPFYMAPEQILGETISPLSDQYSLGCTLYHMVTGRPPFVEGDVLYHHIHTAPVSPRGRNPQIPVWLDAIILRTLVKDRTKRFPSVAVLLQELDRCLAGARGTNTQTGDASH